MRRCITSKGGGLAAGVREESTFKERSEGIVRTKKKQAATPGERYFG